jgi:hypothetical protein
MDPPLPFAASAEAGSSTAITTHKTKRMMHLSSIFTLTQKGMVRMQRPDG